MSGDATNDRMGMNIVRAVVHLLRTRTVLDATTSHMEVKSANSFL
jgi:hypothetical protein